jgi:pyruvate dehydrogenase E2 component (dihydrolipoyllysine-residue acetyltransferase)
VASPVKLPRLGQGMESGTVVKWLKSEGDKVERGDLLYELDTEKVTQEVEADVAGVLLKIAVPEGEVDVGTTLAFIGEPGEKVEEPEPTPEPKTEPEPQHEPDAPPAREEPEPALPQAVERTAGDRVKASPLARRLARERGVDLAAVAGTGPEGRIIAEDVERTATSPTAAPADAAPAAEVERVELTSIRRTIARRLTEAWQIPVFQLQASADMTRATALLDDRRRLEPDVHVTVTDLMTKVCAAALMRHREVNVRFTDDAILRFPTVNMGIAVATPKGLFVPVIRGAERLQLSEIAAARADLVERARAGRLRQEDVDDGTFTVSNLGMYRVERFTAVLNPPQAAILAVGAIEDRAVPEDGEIVVRSMTTVIGTFDHRAVDGAPAAAFMDTVKALLEEPGLAL